MKTMVLLSFWMLLCVSGCSVLHQVDLDQRDQWLAGAQKDLLGNDARVVTTDGKMLEGKIVRLTVDSVWVQAEPDNTETGNALIRVSLIQQPRQVFPAIGGLLGGALVGAIVGTGFGTASEPPRADMLGFNTVASGLNGMMIGAMVGGVAGVVGLGLATAADDYQIIRVPTRKAPNESGSR